MISIDVSNLNFKLEIVVDCQLPVKNLFDTILKKTEWT